MMTTLQHDHITVQESIPRSATESHISARNLVQQCHVLTKRWSGNWISIRPTACQQFRGVSWEKDSNHQCENVMFMFFFLVSKSQGKWRLVNFWAPYTKFCNLHMNTKRTVHYHSWKSGSPEKLKRYQPWLTVNQHSLACTLVGIPILPPYIWSTLFVHWCNGLFGTIAKVCRSPHNEQNSTTTGKEYQYFRDSAE